MKKWFLALIISIFIVATKVKAELFLTTHLLPNTKATKYLPEYASTSYHGAYRGVLYGHRYIFGESFKTGSKTQGSEKTSTKLSAGYHFLNSKSHKFGITYDRAFTKYQTENEIKGKDPIDSFGLQFNFGIFAIKAGCSNHALKMPLIISRMVGHLRGMGLTCFLVNSLSTWI
jgi:hypothetical protein